MKVGLGLVPQNYPDWDRYVATIGPSGPQQQKRVIEDALVLARLADS